MSLIVDVHRDLGSFKLDVSFELPRPDETLALLGPSGCGKSLTLGCIAGTVTPDEGRIVLDDRVLFDSEAHVNLPPQERHVGYLFQAYALFPHMTVVQNVMVGARGSRAERREKAERQLALMRLEGLASRRPAQLSGGQQQRVALARILASEPELVLLDEPFSALDGYLRWQLEMELQDTLRAFPGGAIYVSHDRDEVYRLCDRVCVVSEGVSDPVRPTKEFFQEPRTVAGCLISGCKNISTATLTEGGDLWCDQWGVALRTSEPIPQNVAACGLRAHHFEVGEGPNAIPCTVDRVIDNVFSTIVMAGTPGGAQLRYETTKEGWAELGDPDTIVLSIAPEHVMALTDGRPA